MRSAQLSIGVIALLLMDGAWAQNAQTPPPDLNGFWTHGFSLGFDPPPEGGPGPIADIKGKAALRAAGQHIIYEGDATNPILQPWAAAAVKKRADEEARGIHTPTKQEICYPSGVPNYWTHPLTMQVVQTSGYIVFFHARDHQIRIVRLNAKHPANLKPTWYGDSVGHFEGDTLVIDTIGLNDKTPVDIFNTPHTTQEHVIERIRTVDGPNGAKNLQVHFTVEDKGAYTTPWSAIETYRRIGVPGGGVDLQGAAGGPLDEEICAENDRAVGIPNFSIPVEK